MQTITPCLWFDGQAEEAMRFYMSIFDRSKVLSITRCGDAGPGRKGSVLVAGFQLDGQDFLALNGGPQFKFSPAVSFSVNCETQAEVDRFWTKLGEGGVSGQCGWLQDKFGVSWQIVPSILVELLQDSDVAKADRVMRAMMQMTRLDIAALEQAASDA